MELLRAWLVEDSVHSLHDQTAGYCGQHDVVVDAHPVIVARRRTQAIRVVVVNDVAAREVRARQVVAVTPRTVVIARGPQVAPAIVAAPVVMAERDIAIVMPIDVAVVTPMIAAVVTTMIAAVVTTIVAALVAVAIVGLRGGDGAAEERERQSRSSEQTFHFDLPV